MFHPISRRDVLLIAAAGGVSATAPAWAQGNIIQSQDSNIAGVISEIIQCRRREGVLDIRLRFVNASDKEASFSVSGYDAYYVTAGSKKYFILRDAEKNPLATSLGIHNVITVKLAKGASYTWWARYPAPPADVKKVNFFNPLTPPFDDLPIAD